MNISCSRFCCYNKSLFLPRQFKLSTHKYLEQLPLAWPGLADCYLSANLGNLIKNKGAIQIHSRIYTHMLHLSIQTNLVLLKIFREGKTNAKASTFHIHTICISKSQTNRKPQTCVCVAGWISQLQKEPKESQGREKEEKREIKMELKGKEYTLPGAYLPIVRQCNTFYSIPRFKWIMASPASFGSPQFWYTERKSILFWVRWLKFRLNLTQS